MTQQNHLPRNATLSPDLPTNKQEWAKYWAERGFKVLRLPPDQKSPPLGEGWQHFPTKTPEQAFDLWGEKQTDSTNFNIAIQTGVEFVVLDFDYKKGGRESLFLVEAMLPEDTLTVTTPGGTHLYFKHEPDMRGGSDVLDHANFPGVDVRGHNGYVVAPGSILNNDDYTDMGYTIRTNADLAPLPDFLIKALGPRPLSPPAEQIPVVDLDTDLALQKATDWLNTTDGLDGHSIEGDTYGAACRMKDFAISEDTAVEMLFTHERQFGDISGEAQMEASIRNAYRYATNSAPGADLAKLAEHEFGRLSDEEIADMHARERKNTSGNHEDSDFDPVATETKPPVTWKVQSASAFTADYVAPEYVVDGIVQRGRMYTLTAPTGHGKTAAMLYLSCAISTGDPFCGRETEKGDVLFLAGENPDDVRARVIATAEYHRIPIEKLNLHFIAGVFSIRQDLQDLAKAAKALPNLIAIVPDTFAAYFDGDNENDNAQALDFARMLRKLTTLPSKPCIIMPSHPIKNATRETLVPKGGSSLLNEVDGNLTIWNESGLMSMHWQGKHRGPEFDPVQMEISAYETDSVRDRRGRRMPTVLAKPVDFDRAKELTGRTLSLETAVMQSLVSAPSMSLRDRATSCGTSKSAIDRVLKRLEKQKWISKSGRKLKLTPQGIEALKDGIPDLLQNQVDADSAE